MKFFKLFSLLLLCLMMSSQAFAAGDTTTPTPKTLRITVQSQNGQPVSNKKVTLGAYNQTGGSAVIINKTYRTDAFGMVDFDISGSNDKGGTAFVKINNEGMVVQIPGGTGIISVTITL